MVDCTLLVALGTLAQQQHNCTENTVKIIHHLLDYCASHPDATLRFYASDMTLRAHSDASYLSESEAHSRVGGHFFLGPNPTITTNTNGAILNTSTILKVIVSSATEAEYAALFQNGKEAVTLRSALEELGHKQNSTILYTDNATAKGIAHQTLKQKHSKAMDMCFYWIQDRVKQKHFQVEWEPGENNRDDYFTKHHPTKHHIHMRPQYLHCPA